MGIPTINLAPPKPKLKRAIKAYSTSKNPKISHPPSEPTPMSIFIISYIKQIPPKVTKNSHAHDQIVSDPHINENIQSTEVTLVVEDTSILEDTYVVEDTLYIEDTSIALENIQVYRDVSPFEDKPHAIEDLNPTEDTRFFKFHLHLMLQALPIILSHQSSQCSRHNFILNLSQKPRPH